MAQQATIVQLSLDKTPQNWTLQVILLTVILLRDALDISFDYTLLSQKFICLFVKPWKKFLNKN